MKRSELESKNGDCPWCGRPLYDEGESEKRMDSKGM